jgi:hypothetical protein
MVTPRDSHHNLLPSLPGLGAHGLKEKESGPPHSGRPGAQHSSSKPNPAALACTSAVERKEEMLGVPRTMYRGE